MAAGTYERRLVTALSECGFAPMRAPASGSATDRDLPDVLAGRRVHRPESPDTHTSAAWAVELKSGKATTLYVDAAEVEALERFADVFGARALLGATFKRPNGSRTPIWLLEPADARLTDAGHYGLPEKGIEERAYARVLPATNAKAASVTVLKGIGCEDSP